MNHQPRRRSARGRWAVVLAAVLACIALVAPAFTPAASAAAPGITFVFDYSENPPGVGFLDPVEGPARRAAVDAAATLYHDLFASHFSNSATLTIRILSSVNPDDGVAYAYSEVVRTPGTFGNGEVIRTKLITGVDQNGAQYDGTVFFDFQPDLHWELDPNASVDTGEVSFYNAMLHEFTHAIGFASMTVGGTADVFGDGSPGSGSPGTWNKWDQFLTDGATYVVDPATFTVNQTAFNNTEPFGGYFVGPNAVAANGGPVHLSTQRSHLDDNLFPTALMKSGGVDVGIPGVVNTRVWNNVEVGILTDLGYTPVPPTATPTNTPVPTATRTNTPVPTATRTNTPVPATATKTNTPTNTPVTATATRTNTPVPATATKTNTPTKTPSPTATKTPSPTTTPAAPPSFPTSGILDTFNRADGPIGANWAGATGTGFYKIASQKVNVLNSGALYWKAGDPFGINQEAFVTLTTVATGGTEQDLLLKVQGGSNPDWTKGVIEVLYTAKANNGAGAIHVETFRPSKGSWTVYASTPVTYRNGDQLGARALANGEIWIYKNGLLVTKNHAQHGRPKLLQWQGRANRDVVHQRRRCHRR